MACKAVRSTIEREIAPLYDHRMVFVEADMATTERHAKLWGVGGLPTILIFHQERAGNTPWASINGNSKQKIVAKIEEVLRR